MFFVILLTVFCVKANEDSLLADQKTDQDLHITQDIQPDTCTEEPLEEAKSAIDMQAIKIKKLSELNELDRKCQQPDVSLFGSYSRDLTSKKENTRTQAFNYFIEQATLCDIKIARYEQIRSQKFNKALIKGGVSVGIAITLIIGSLFHTTDNSNEHKTPWYNYAGGVSGAISIFGIWEYVRDYYSKSAKIDRLEAPWKAHKEEIEKRFNLYESKQFLPALIQETEKLSKEYQNSFPLIIKNYDKRCMYADVSTK
jgi:hypothetical protein